MDRRLTRIVSVAVVFALTFGVLTLGVYAYDYGKAKEGCYWNLEEKFSYKAHFILKNTEELGLSDKQVEKIKDLKVKTKKALIGKKAELDVLALDIKGELWKDTIDTGAVNKLIDKKYELKKEKARSLVSAYAALKGILTEKQKEKMKELRKKCKKEMLHGSKMKSKVGHQMMKGKMESHMKDQ